VNGPFNSPAANVLLGQLDACYERALRAESALHGHEHTINLAAKVRIGQLERLLLATDERAKRAEAEIRAKDEAIGELLALMPHVVDVKHIDWPPR
jgi:hypothetical protein